MGKAQRKIERVVKLHREWLRDSGSEILEYTSQRMQRSLAEESLPALRTMKSSLGSLALYYGTKGVVELFDGDLKGWDDVFLSGAYHLHELRLRFALWTRLGDEPGFTSETSNVGCALCFSLANGLVEWADLLANVLKQAERSDQMVPKEYWNERVFEPFVLRLFAIYARTTGDDRQIPARYAAVLAGWDSPKELSEALSAACDYHCDNMNASRKDDWDPEFGEPPFDLIPWEVLAIREVRTRLGLTTPLPAHPLLETTDTFAPRGRLPADERLNAVERLRIGLGMTVRE